MQEIYTEIEINAPASVVWSILTDFDNFPKWNPFIKEIMGVPQERSQIEVLIKPPNSNGIRFKPKILVYQPEKEIRWIGKFWIPNLFDGEHSLSIKEIEDNKVLFIQKERFDGLLVPLFSRTLKNTKTGFEMMNKALKREAERKNS